MDTWTHNTILCIVSRKVRTSFNIRFLESQTNQLNGRIMMVEKGQITTKNNRNLKKKKKKKSAKLNNI